MLIGDVGLPVTGDSLATSTIADQTSSTISIVLMGSFQITPAGTYSNAALTAGYASGVYIADGTRITDAVGLTPAIGNDASARDVASILNAISLEWVATDDALARSWDLNTILNGVARNTVTDALDLGIINRGDLTVDLEIKTSSSTPSGWAPAGAAGLNVFLVKAHNGSPADPTDPSLYALSLTLINQDLMTVLYPGSSTGLNLYFRAPTSLTLGGGTAQTITITVTARAPP
jgi:hypothetical protein